MANKHVLYGIETRIMYAITREVSPEYNAIQAFRIRWKCIRIYLPGSYIFFLEFQNNQIVLN